MSVTRMEWYGCTWSFWTGMAGTASTAGTARQFRTHENWEIAHDNLDRHKTGG